MQAGGINENIIPLLSLLFIILYLLISTTSPALVTIMLMSFVLTALMLSFNKTWYPWHMFQFMLIPFFTLMHTERRERLKYVQYALLAGIIAINLPTTIPNTLRDQEDRTTFKIYRRAWDGLPYIRLPE